MANIYSAGIETHGVNPKAVKTMAKIGIDISGQTSNHIDEYLEIPMDFLLSVCDHAKESCPIFKTLGVHLHYNFLDPSKTIGTTEEIEESFDDVRDLIDEYCREFAQTHFGNLI